MPEVTKPSIPVRRMRSVVVGSNIALDQIFEETVRITQDEKTRQELIDHKAKFDEAVIFLDGILERLPECKN